MSGNFKRKMTGLCRPVLLQVVEVVTDFRRTATGGTSTTVRIQPPPSLADDDIYIGIHPQDSVATPRPQPFVGWLTPSPITQVRREHSPLSSRTQCQFLGDTFDVYLQVRAEKPEP